MQKSYLLLAVLLLIISFGCKTEGDTTSSSNRMDKAAHSVSATVDQKTETAPAFVHAVYFWMNDSDAELSKVFMTKGLTELAKVSSIKHVYWGPPAETNRDVIDSSYDVAWIVTFDSPEDQEAYQVDPIHLKFIEQYSSVWEKVKVYDNTVIGSR